MTFVRLRVSVTASGSRRSSDPNTGPTLSCAADTSPTSRLSSSIRATGTSSVAVSTRLPSRARETDLCSRTDAGGVGGGAGSARAAVGIGARSAAGGGFTAGAVTGGSAGGGVTLDAPFGADLVVVGAPSLAGVVAALGAGGGDGRGEAPLVAVGAPTGAGLPDS